MFSSDSCSTLLLVYLSLDSISYKPDKHKKFDLRENFCRNPDKDVHGPWCFTNSSETRYEQCGLPHCSEGRATHHNWSIPFANKMKGGSGTEEKSQKLSLWYILLYTGAETWPYECSTMSVCLCCVQWSVCGVTGSHTEDLWTTQRAEKNVKDGTHRDLINTNISLTGIIQMAVSGLAMATTHLHTTTLHI